MDYQDIKDFNDKKISLKRHSNSRKVDSDEETSDEAKNGEINDSIQSKDFSFAEDNSMPLNNIIERIETLQCQHEVNVQ